MDPEPRCCAFSLRRFLIQRRLVYLEHKESVCSRQWDMSSLTALNSEYLVLAEVVNSARQDRRVSQFRGFVSERRIKCRLFTENCKVSQHAHAHTVFNRRFLQYTPWSICWSLIFLHLSVTCASYRNKQKLFSCGPSYGTALSIALRPSVRPSVRLSVLCRRFSGNSKVVETSN